MKRIIIGMSVLVVLVIVAAVIVIPHLVNIEQYRGRIEAAIRQRTGLEPTLGQMTLKIVPAPSLRIHPLGLNDPEGRVRLEGADLAIRAQLGPLLHRRLVIERITIRHPHLTLTRSGDALALPALPAQPEASPQAGTGHFGVEVDRVEVRDGSVSIPGNPRIPAWGLSHVSMRLSPAEANFEGGARIDAGGTLRWSGTLGRTARISLEGVPARALEPWLPHGLVRSGTITAGTLTVKGRSSVDAHLDLANVKLLAGTRPLKRATVELTAVRRGQRLRVSRLQLTAGRVTIRGAGWLMPALDLRFSAGATPIGEVVTMARAVFPVPVTVQSPGSFAGTIRMEREGDAPLRFSGGGTLRAAALVVTAGIPTLEKVRTTFSLHPDGSLSLTPFDASVVGGVLAGRVTLGSIDPPGVLRFDGTLAGADLAKMLHAFSPGAAGGISGTTNIDAAVALVLSRPRLDARALSGTVHVTARDLVVPGWNLVGALHDLGRGQTSLIGLFAQLTGGSSSGQATAGSSDRTETIGRARFTMHLDRIPWTLSGVSLEAEDVTARGQGTFDPLAGRIDLDLTVHVAKELTARLVRRASMLENLKDAEGRLALPMTITGPVAKPSIAFDIGRVLGRHDTHVKQTGHQSGRIEDLVKQLLQRH